MKRIVTTTALVAALLGMSTAARADHGAPSVGVTVTPGSVDLHVHSATCGHHVDESDYDDDSDRWSPRERVVHRPGGFYELRMVDVWIPAQRVEQVVPQQCREHGGKHHKLKCKGGYVETRVIPGRYESREQWVWVAASPRPRGVVRARW
jgi:hypothetical protein